MYVIILLMLKMFLVISQKYVNMQCIIFTCLNCLKKLCNHMLSVLCLSLEKFEKQNLLIFVFK